MIPIKTMKIFNMFKPIDNQLLSVLMIILKINAPIVKINKDASRKFNTCFVILNPGYPKRDDLRNRFHLSIQYWIENTRMAYRIALGTITA